MDLDQYAAYVTSVVLTNEYAQAALNSDIYESVSENLPFAAELAKVVAEVVPRWSPSTCTYRSRTWLSTHSRAQSK
jgi:hypothetical protein